MILIMLGAGTGAGFNLNKAYAKGANWTFVCLSWGMAVAMGVYVAGSLGSMGHLNPAVTIGFACFGFFPWSQVLPYLAGQFLGAFVGAALVIIQFFPHFKATPDEASGNQVGIFATRPAIKSPLFNFISELFATFAFIFILLNLGNFTQGLKPFIVGFLIFVIGTGLGTTTGFAINQPVTGAHVWPTQFCRFLTKEAHIGVTLGTNARTAGRWNSGCSDSVCFKGLECRKRRFDAII